MKKITRILTVLLLTTAFFAACGPQEVKKPLDEVTVQLNWMHANAFAGYYAADQNGYYAAEGLAVTFLEGGADIDHIASVLDGEAQFGTVTADALILARAEEKPVHAIATIYRRSPVVFFALADSGITRPQDLVGKKIRVTTNLVPTLHAMMARVGISPDQYTEVTLPSDVALFASGQVPVWGAYLTALVTEVKQAGYKVNLIYPDDYGVHFYGNSIFARDDYIAANPDVVRRFLRATLKGWTYAVEHPTAIGQMVVKYKPDADAAREVAQMTASLPLVNTGEDFIGWMKPETWAGMEKTLREQGVLTQTLNVTQVYTLQFVKEIYGK
jgi:ABC-type nitrate/sulfonate/bicarbonate transport system substrate-binding protein